MDLSELRAFIAVVENGSFLAAARSLDALLPDPGLPPDALVPVLEQVVGQERPIRISAPDALSEIPKVRMVIEHARRFTQVSVIGRESERQGMFEIVKDRSGQSRFTLRGWGQGHGFDIVPGLGACLSELRFGSSILTEGECTLLFPFGGRRRGDNALASLDSLVHDMPFDVTHTHVTEDTAELGCKLVTSGQSPAYPFPFALEAHFAISTGSSFAARFSVQNRHHEPIPVGLGYRMCFRLLLPSAGGALTLPPCDRVEVDQAGIPTGARTPIEALSGNGFITKVASARFLSDDAPDPTYRIAVHGCPSRLVLHLSAGQFPFFEVSVPRSLTGVALTLMTCKADAFHTGDGLVSLAPGATFRAGFLLSATRRRSGGRRSPSHAHAAAWDAFE